MFTMKTVQVQICTEEIFCREISGILVGEACLRHITCDAKQPNKRKPTNTLSFLGNFLALVGSTCRKNRTQWLHKFDFRHWLVFSRQRFKNKIHAQIVFNVFPYEEANWRHWKFVISAIACCVINLFTLKFPSPRKTLAVRSSSVNGGMVRPVWVH